MFINKAKKLLHGKRVGKQGRVFLLMTMDACLIFISVSIVFFILRNENLYPIIPVSKWLIPTIILIGLPLYIFSNQYKSLTRYVGANSFFSLAFRNGVLLFLISFFSNFFGLPRPSISSWILIWFTLSTLTSITRLLARDLLVNFDKSKLKIKRIAIYGSGTEAIQLAAALKISKTYEIICFIDNLKSLHNRTIWDLPIKSINYLDKNTNIEEIFLAKPSLNKETIREVFLKAKKKNIGIAKIPSIEEITTGKTKIDSLKPISIESLLGRDEIYVNLEYVKYIIENNSICVTGAGGSIGSELCEQIIRIKPKKIILFEQSEINLYKLLEKLKENISLDTEIIPILASANNVSLLEKVLKNENIEVIFHTAAYKHVPLVEKNPISGIENNVLTTLSVCEAAVKTKAKQVILVSTDKAVRPSNVMGASKRLAEIIFQAFASKESKLGKEDKDYIPTLFSIVRFGNVLASSGSVVPLFKKQINNGGPITLTHRDIVRYFMTIKEAVRLILITTTMTKGGDVFLLDMGEPVKIFSLAEQMIKLSGLTIKNEENPEGDIEIVETGLRPGEKLFEELLINAEAIGTDHPLIFRANENYIEYEELIIKLKLLEKAINLNNLKEVLKNLSILVPEWKAKL
ncbi:MAG: polysaccharide biosynthesis protein [Prochlorococcus marinus CUG1439]|uniref:nucleoside-diphosphate sugar epimerase/dehydratase n=1 Tax=Prochlorococcus sp. MIT 1314 TaxID=3096220 RepID=UPI002A5F844A|nr:nucleoside-diphosphate sugar epimerase/dehydratase [Prochlorococcus sp. MIT 1314]MCR8538765.1 polysaccharide biosynthesis protein [Prochlorococcus marinus CUG1439]